jgi:hypothetical protein
MSNPSRMTLPLIPYSLGKGQSKLPRSALHLNICLPYLMRSISNEKCTWGNCTPSKCLPAAPLAIWCHNLLYLFQNPPNHSCLIYLTTTSIALFLDVLATLFLPSSETSHPFPIPSTSSNRLLPHCLCQSPKCSTKWCMHSAPRCPSPRASMSVWDKSARLKPWRWIGGSRTNHWHLLGRGMIQHIIHWYVSNVYIIFDAPCLFLHHLPCVSLHFVAFLCDFRN